MPDNVKFSKYVDGGFSFSLNPYLRRQYSFKVFINRKILKHRQAFTMANNMASSGLLVNVTLTKINNYHTWHHWFADKGTWC